LVAVTTWFVGEKNDRVVGIVARPAAERAGVDAGQVSDRAAARHRTIPRGVLKRLDESGVDDVDRNTRPVSVR
jgi:hypothetical protein